MAEVEIVARENGPLLVKGDIKIVDHDGTVLTPAKTPVALCRCGQSKNKPFCDATHRAVGFDGTCARQVANS
jgi:CDGSH-type Zn-finger protein